MRKPYTIVSLLIAVCIIAHNALGQFNPDTVRVGKYDQGKMWTFDTPPSDYFEKTYGFRPSPQWLDEVRMSALRFADYCSASFVSADGLIMTNHHCARESGTAVQKAGENFGANGFLALTQGEERNVPGLFVDQLMMIEDITARVQHAMDKAKTDTEKVNAREAEFELIKTGYAAKENWKGLELEVVTFYQGGKYSLYGYQRYNDVRLVAMPELALGFFGGDFDNFTYPRYCLDFSFFRVYDTLGNPLKAAHYFKFNNAGAQEGEPVFVVGNPGSTIRQAPVSMLNYYRNYLWPAYIKQFSARSAILQHLNTTLKNDSITDVIFGFENSIKALKGQQQGLEEPAILSRKIVFEREFKSKIRADPKLKDQLVLWDKIEKIQETKSKKFKDVLYLGDNMNSDAYKLGLLFYQYASTISKDEKSAFKMADKIRDYKNPFSNEIEKEFLTQHIAEVLANYSSDDPYVKILKGIKSPRQSMLEYPGTVNSNEPSQIAEAILSQTKVYDKRFREELLAKGKEAITVSTDPILLIGRIAWKKYNETNTTFKALNNQTAIHRADIAKLLFKAYGTSMPPDANFTLRIADGVVKGYEYNGTKAPYKTTFYGLYDRYHSFNKTFPWNLPDKWLNPPSALLEAPVDFVSSNDITGGNSGSPIINKNREVVGLVFDGNIESLPGDYIFLPEFNRTVSVHAGGIIAALRYIYKADRLVKELSGE